MKKLLFRSLLLALLLGAVTGVVGQNENITMFTGTWKLNPAKSKFNPGPPFKSFTLIFARDGIRYLNLTHASGQLLKASLPWSDGIEVPVKVTEGSMANVTVISKIRGWSLDDTWKENGEIIEKLHGRVSMDGNTLIINVEGMENQGRNYHNRLIFEKQ